jgi:antitoxin ParD1/3/4
MSSHADANQECRNKANPLIGISGIHRWLLSAQECCLDKRLAQVRPLTGPARVLATIDIYCQYGLLPTDRFRPRSPILSSTLNVQLTDALRKYVDERASDKDVYATPSEYIRDLIRQDMQDRAVALNILEGLGDLRHGRFSDKSILDFKDED